MEEQFKTGTVVKLKSGGSEMVVHSCDNKGNYLCNWHTDKGEHQGNYYLFDQLMKII
jgi:uncharacterized protein YodC (DUF2158 family)